MAECQTEPRPPRQQPAACTVSCASGCGTTAIQADSAVKQDSKVGIGHGARNVHSSMFRSDIRSILPEPPIGRLATLPVAPIRRLDSFAIAPISCLNVLPIPPIRHLDVFPVTPTRRLESLAAVPVRRLDAFPVASPRRLDSFVVAPVGRLATLAEPPVGRLAYFAEPPICLAMLREPRQGRHALFLGVGLQCLAHGTLSVPSGWKRRLGQSFPIRAEHPCWKSVVVPKVCELGSACGQAQRG